MENKNKHRAILFTKYSSLSSLIPLLLVLKQKIYSKQLENGFFGTFYRPEQSGIKLWAISFLAFNKLLGIILATRVNNFQYRRACKENKTQGAIHKLRRQDFEDFWASLPLRRQVYYISLCISIVIWQTPLPLACLRSLCMAPNTKVVLYTG